MPLKGFVWEGWESDSPCSFVGPSSLFQRWNMHMRRLFDLISDDSKGLAVKPVEKVVLLIRTERANPWGSARSSRLFLNTDEIVEAVKKTISATRSHSFVFEVHDFAKLKFVDQIRLMSETSVFIGMHGAGIAMSMFMSIGSPLCCAVLEIFPKGEFTPARGHGSDIL